MIIETYGSGNAPTKPWFLDIVRQAASAGKVLVSVTQCLAGTVTMDLYATGKGLKEAGVLSGYDSTTEAMLAKLFYLFGSGRSKEDIKSALGRSMRGEITVI